jgi:serine/threonine protein kinase
MSETGKLEDFNVAITMPQLIKDPVLAGGHCERLADNSPRRYTGGYCVVYPYICTNGKKYAIRCWFAKVPDAQYKAEQISRKIQELKLPYFVGFNYVEQGISATGAIRPIVRMDWVEAEDLRAFVTRNIKSSNKTMLERLLENFVKMVSLLHKHNISHGDLQHGNILALPDASLKLVDYDSMYIDEVKNTHNEIAGLRGFQHPSRKNDTKPSPKADYFAELVIYITLKVAIECPSLWNKHKCDKDSNDLIFKSSDFDDISRSPAYKEVFAISDDMAKLVTKLKESCQKKHFDELQPLETLIEDLNVTTINRPVDTSGLTTNIIDKRKKVQKDARDHKPQRQNPASVDVSNMLEKRKKKQQANKAQQEIQQEAQQKENNDIIRRITGRKQNTKNDQ